MRDEVKIQAIKDSIKLWRWLKDHPGERKNAYFGIHPEIRVPMLQCFLCEHYHRPPACPECPLSDIGVPCFNEGKSKSDWASWFIRRDKPSATKIYNALRRALRKAENE